MWAGELAYMKDIERTKYSKKRGFMSSVYAIIGEISSHNRVVVLVERKLRQSAQGSMVWISSCLSLALEKQLDSTNRVKCYIKNFKFCMYYKENHIRICIFFQYIYININKQNLKKSSTRI